MPVFLHYIFVSFFIALLIKIDIPKEHRLSNWQITFLGLFLFSTYLYIISIFYFIWSPIGNSFSIGAQGRYFLPLAPFGILFLINLKYIKKIYPFVFIVLMLITINGTITTIYERFYDISKLEVQLPEINKNKKYLKTTNITIDKPFISKVKVDTKTKIKGFSINLKQDDKIKVGYILDLKDSKCEKKLFSKTVELYKISKNGYFFSIDPFASKEEDLCLIIRPMDSAKIYLQIYKPEIVLPYYISPAYLFNSKD